MDGEYMSDFEGLSQLIGKMLFNDGLSAAFPSLGLQIARGHARDARFAHLLPTPRMTECAPLDMQGEPQTFNEEAA